MKPFTRKAQCLALAAALGSLASLSASAANPASATTTTGQTLNIQIDSPLEGASVPQGPLTVKGRTSVGPLNLNTAVVYVLEESSTTGDAGGMDCNGDGVVNAADNYDAKQFDNIIGNTFDCELAGTTALNESLVGVPVVVAGLVLFSSTGDYINVSPLVPGLHFFVDPATDTDGDGRRDVAQQAADLDYQGGAPNFDAGLGALNNAFATRPTTEKHVAFFLSKGLPSPGTFTTGAGSPLAAAAAAGTQINTYSIGPSAAGCGTSSVLKTIADATGGSCTVVVKPSTLVNMLPHTTPTGIDFVQVSADGAPAVTATLDPLGNFSGSPSISGYGAHQLYAQVFATDGTNTFATVNVTSPNPNADVSIVKTSPQSSVLAGDNITYNLSVSNAGPATATGVVVTDSLPAATSYVSAGTSQGGCNLAGSTVSCNLGSIANGGLVNITLVVKANSSGAIVNSASVSSTSPDPNTTGNNASSVTVTSNKRPSSITAKPAIATVLSGSLLQLNVKFEAQLSAGTSVAGKPIVFTAGAGTCTGTTNASGVATCSLNLSRLLAATLNFGYSASFAGDAVLLPSSVRAPALQVLGIPIF